MNPLLNSQARHLICCLLLLLAAFAPASLWADNPVAFHHEMEGDAHDAYPNGLAPDDWDTLLGLAPGGSGQVVSKIFLPDFHADPNSDDIFITGGSKDTLDISQWRWSLGSVPDKDDITNAYAALYPHAGGALHFVFGLDRYANNGDAQLGFWLMHHRISKAVNASGEGIFTDGTIGPDGFPLPAHHHDGDVLILVHFTQGGSNVELEVFQWVGEGESGSLQFVIGGIDCTNPAPTQACAEVNHAAGTPSPWPYTPKSGAANQFPEGSFFEGAVNLAAFIDHTQCFAGFLAETRSSQSLDSQLKDFAFGELASCSMAVTKSGPACAKVGDTVTYEYTVSNTGYNTLYLQSAVDVSNGSAGSVDLMAAEAVPQACQTLAAGASCSFQWSALVAPGDPDPLENTVTFVYNDAQDGSGLDLTESASWSVDLTHPDFTVTKTCPGFAKVGDVLNYEIRIQNTGEVEMAITSISDSLVGPFPVPPGTVIAAGASQSFSYNHTVGAQDPNPLVNTVTVTGTPTQACGPALSLERSSSCSTQIVHPAVSVTKTCDPFGLVGQLAHYTITVTNTGDVALEKVSLDDSLMGALSGCDSLAVGASCTLNLTRTILATDPDPLPNTVTARYLIAAGIGVSGEVSDAAGCATEILRPSIRIEKSCDPFGLVGAPVNYQITVTNTGDAPLVKVALSDTLLGALPGCDTLAPGQSCSVNLSRTVLPTDPDPLPNTATALYAVAGGFGVSAQVSDTASCATDILHPALRLDKACDPFTLVGGTVNYQITVTNAGDVPLVKVALTDTLLGALSGCDTLAPGQSCTVNGSRVVLTTDPDPLPNTATALYAVASGFGVSAQVSATGSCATDILHPGVVLTKTCLTDPVPVGASANFRINVENTGDAPVVVHLQDPLLSLDMTFNLGVKPPGGSCTSDISDPANGCFMVEASLIATGGSIQNIAWVDLSLPSGFGIGGEVGHVESSATCTVSQGGATRTVGFWRTHGDYTDHVFNVHLGGAVNLGWRTLDSTAEVLGLFWASPSQNSDGGSRDVLCQARVITSKQALAAYLNSGLTNGQPLPLPWNDIVAILGASDIGAIQSLGSLLDGYNNSGDAISILDGDGYLVQRANPQAALAAASVGAADCVSFAGPRPPVQRPKGKILQDRQF